MGMHADQSCIGCLFIQVWPPKAWKLPCQTGSLSLIPLCDRNWLVKNPVTLILDSSSVCAFNWSGACSAWRPVFHLLHQVQFFPKALMCQKDCQQLHISYMASGDHRSLSLIGHWELPPECTITVGYVGNTGAWVVLLCMVKPASWGLPCWLYSESELCHISCLLLSQCSSEEGQNSLTVGGLGSGASTALFCGRMDRFIDIEHA